MTVELALDGTRKCWEVDWKPKGVDPSTPELAPAQKKSKGKDGRPIVTTAAFLADSDDEEDATAHLLADVVVEREDELQEKMARLFLAPPASTSGVERAFSAVGHMHGDLRKCTAECTNEHSLMAGMNT
ncbi:hypothetical protein CYMTET_8427 [Cymbomonas tetramitiformis]|uniref:HAT C-terminal dimerisation domain-containing protein n=1 Tax=Cymbomonas tetramitiformis TaxID=36881 RepID=A0AAE0LGI2_9CHLO|nr:hypothetical protein CYMTET_8427 [Cymbomonas tetramitiformis]